MIHLPSTIRPNWVILLLVAVFSTLSVSICALVFRETPRGFFDPGKEPQTGKIFPDADVSFETDDYVDASVRWQRDLQNITISRTSSGFLLRKDSHRFVSIGVNVVQPEEEWPGDPKYLPQKASGYYNVLTKYEGDLTAWATDTVERLKSWGFNTAAAWCHDELYRQPIYHTRVIWFGGKKEGEDKRLIDVFSDEYAQNIEVTALEEVAQHKDNPWLIGYFLNNELPWFGEYGWPSDPNKSLLDQYFALSVTAPGRQRLFCFFRDTYKNIEKFRVDWETSASSWEELAQERVLIAKGIAAKRVKYEWAGKVAERYFSLCADSIFRNDPHHLILGCRFAGQPPMAVLKAIIPYTDVVSINTYDRDGEPNIDLLRNIYALTKMPVMVTEFSWRANDNRSGNKNSRGADTTVSTQQDRANRYRTFFEKLVAEPYIVGVHWFQYHDQPTAGRWFDGEDSNYGLVDISDEPYEELLSAMIAVHADVSNVIETRSNKVPKGFDEQSWGELLSLRLASGDLLEPVSFSASESVIPVKSMTIAADNRAGNQGSWEQDTNSAWVLNYKSVGGWGLHGDLPVIDHTIAGATYVEVDLKAPEGVKLQLFLTETGDGPVGLQIYEGENNADGEAFELQPVIASGNRETYRFMLSEAEVRAHWGNQRGNRTIDTQGLKAVSFFIPPGQGTGQVAIHAIRFGSELQTGAVN